jgi:serine/threonine protein kinase
MAPEQVRGEPCDAQSDLFSLGSVMYALCAGHPPFREETLYAVMQRIVHDQPRNLCGRAPDVPRWLEEFIFRLLAKDKPRRFGTAEEVVAILEKELAHLQNPHSSVQPKRHWRRIRGSRSVRYVQTARRIVIALLLMVVSAATAGWLLDHRPENSGNPEGSEATTRAGSLALPTVPLWDADGTYQLRAAADQLQADWHAAAPEPHFDPWLQKSQWVRQRLAELSAADEGL